MLQHFLALQDGTIIIGPDASRSSAVVGDVRESAEVEYLTGEERC